MIWILLLISVVITAIGMTTASSADTDRWIAAGVAMVVLGGAGVVAFVIVISSQADEVRQTKNQSICSQITGAQWISDNNTCIKNGKVILP